MATPMKSHGMKIYIGTQTGAAASEASWTLIGGAYATGDAFGVTYGSVDGTSFDDAYKQMYKTVPDVGGLDLSIRRDIGDAGQVALKAAALDKTQVPYNFKITLDDDAASIGDNPTKWTVKARVMSFETGLGNVNSLVDLKAKLVFTEAPVETAASA